MYLHINLAVVLVVGSVWVLAFILGVVLICFLELLSFLGGSRTALGELCEAPGVLEGLLKTLGGCRKFYVTSDTNGYGFIL
jgi:hypothetical protein